ncbi:MFS transporter [Halobacillus litoralis]|uniref:Major facilitator superfamily (MFS) profile domain-containing protein n=1 Tax=Halobacillus litoralis TaxID=45668 RepID=A0A410MJ55_9BACI|nr:MFS transporter [Halobacillus litoralis]QAS54741.1 hypothetical protein HLI_21015 [Halobacillus litoralis]
MYASLLKDSRVLFLLSANFFSGIGAGVTSVGVVWLILNESNGEQILGVTTLVITLVMFLINPYIGVIVDRFSRKKLYIFNQLLCFCIILPIGLYGLYSSNFHIWQLIVMVFSGSLYWTLHFPTLLAFVQEIFNKEEYNSLSGLLEVESQAATVGVGGMSGIILGHIDYAYVFLFDAFTYLLALVLVLLVPYTKTFEKPNDKEVTFVNDIVEGFKFIKGKALLAIFLLSSLVPFLFIMVSNYLKPIFVNNTLNSSVNVFGFSSMIYAIGAVLAGLFIPSLVDRFGVKRSLIVIMSSFALAIMVMVSVHTVFVFLAIQIFLGTGNAGTRVIRRTVMLHLVDNSMIGRINAFFNTTGLLLRAILIGTFTSAISVIGASTAYLLMGAFVILGIAGVIYTRKILDYNIEEVKPNVMSK